MNTMKKTKSECDTCPIVGYSPDLCRMHLRHMAKGKKRYSSQPESIPWRRWGRNAALGAGVGVVGTVAGMAVFPSLGMKAVLGHLVAAKIAGVGGVAGAGTNVAVNYKDKDKGEEKKKPEADQSNRKKGSFVKSMK